MVPRDKLVSLVDRDMQVRQWEGLDRPSVYDHHSGRRPSDHPGCREPRPGPESLKVPPTGLPPDVVSPFRGTGTCSE